MPFFLKLLTFLFIIFDFCHIIAEWYLFAWLVTRPSFTFFFLFTLIRLFLSFFFMTRLRFIILNPSYTVSFLCCNFDWFFHDELFYWYSNTCFWIFDWERSCPILALILGRSQVSHLRRLFSHISLYWLSSLVHTLVWCGGNCCIRLQHVHGSKSRHKFSKVYLIIDWVLRTCW